MRHLNFSSSKAKKKTTTTLADNQSGSFQGVTLLSSWQRKIPYDRVKGSTRRRRINLARRAGKSGLRAGEAIFYERRTAEK